MAKSPKPKSLKATVTHLEIKRFPHTLKPLPVNLHASMIKATNIPLHCLPLPAMAGGPRMALGQSPAHER